MPSISHQRRAARQRHAAAITTKYQFWADLDQRYQHFTNQYGRGYLERFASAARYRCNSADSGTFRQSTYLTWLREWKFQHPDFTE